MSSTTIKVPPIHVMSIVQLLLTVVLSLLVLLLLGKVEAYSTVLGGLISTVPNAYYAHMVFRHRGASAMPRAIRAIYMGEVIKLLLVGAGFALVLTLVSPLNKIALFVGFVLVHVTGTIALAVIQFRAQQ